MIDTDSWWLLCLQRPDAAAAPEWECLCAALLR